MNRSTIARNWLQVEEKAKNPITKTDDQLSQEDIITLSMIKEARKGNVHAYRALMDSAYGSPKQPIEVGGENGGPIQVERRVNYDELTDDQLREIIARGSNRSE